MTAGSDVIDTIELPPEPGLVDSLGTHHTFVSAIADLVDNCIDAGADRISVRLLTHDEKLVQVEVVDNGRGMGAKAVDAAMTLGHQRKYEASDLGHFGVGLKAASFSHSDVLTVWSRSKRTLPVGRRIHRKEYSRTFACERLSEEAAAACQWDREQQVGSQIGTTVVWSELRSTYRGGSAEEARKWLSATELDLRSHLGITFHRLISSRSLQIETLVDEIYYAHEAVGTPVHAIDPFSYAVTGRPGYPKTLMAPTKDGRVPLHCHIWPAKTDVPGYRLYGKGGGDFQGFFVYRSDRLLQVGGWAHVVTPSNQRRLARVLVEDQSSIAHLLTMNPEKTGLRTEAPFRDAVTRAKADDGTTFEQFLADAEDTYATSIKRATRRKPVIPPASGFAPAVRKQVKKEVGFINSEGLDARWRQMPAGQFFDIDRGTNTLLLNKRYRHLFAPNGGSLNDAPVLKALMFLLTHDIFEGINMGPKDKDNVAVWSAILGAAAQAEQEMRRG